MSLEGHILASENGNGAGRVLNGRYQLLSMLGGGGMAQVYKARDNVLGRIVAVKLLREQYSNDAQFVARFKREAQAAANLAHPNIVNVYDVGQDGDRYYIIMEFTPGQNLKELIKQSDPIPVESAISIAAQILAGLEYAHRNGLIHRDIKPQNVLITPEGGVKVTDFGIAKSVSDLSLTEAGLALGTAHYFSPEQARGERVVPQSDIYAVGVTLYEMLTGRLPFESETVMGLAYKHLSEPPVSPRELNPNVPPRLEAIVLKAMAKEPLERFSSAAEMEKALRSLQAGGQQPTAEIPVAYASMPQAGRAAARATRRGGGATTSPIGVAGLGRGTYAQGNGAAAPTTAGRHPTGPLGAPSSVAMRGESLRSQGGGLSCGVIAALVLVLAVIGGLVAAGIWLGPQISGVFGPGFVVPSPTITPTVPTPTQTETYTPTPTNTPTLTPTATATPVSVPVPQLVGLKVQDAATLAKEKGFNLVELARIDSPQWPVDVVVQQDPPENTSLKKTSVISVRVSNGPPPFKLPNLANTAAGDAQATLETAALKVQLAYEGSPSVPKGVVLRTEPPADATVRPGDIIKLVISEGDVIAVPDLFGMANTDLARARLEAAGLTLGTVTEVADPSGSVPPGAVLAQDPPKGASAARGSPVNVQISRKQ